VLSAKNIGPVEYSLGLPESGTRDIAVVIATVWSKCFMLFNEVMYFCLMLNWCCVIGVR
jgi:hypothetical protein